jgi:hypothetical protein
MAVPDSLADVRRSSWIGVDGEQKTHLHPLSRVPQHFHQNFLLFEFRVISIFRAVRDASAANRVYGDVLAHSFIEG